MIEFITSPSQSYRTTERHEDINNLIDPEKPVQVYRNLHRHCFSVRQSGIVRFHTQYLCLRDVSFHVSQSGRQRVITEGRKNVHAWIKGYICRPDATYNVFRRDIPWSELTYNPYKNEGFVIKGTEQVVTTANYVDLMLDSYGASILAELP